MRKLLKRVISLALAVVMTVTLMSGMELTVEAASGTATTTVSDLGVSYTTPDKTLGVGGSGTVSATGNNITATATGYNFLGNKTVNTEITLKNNKTESARLKFKYTLSSGGSVASSDGKMTNGEYSNNIAAGASVKITLTSPAGASKNTLSITD